MKAFFEQLTTGVESSFSIIDLNMDCFDGPYHFHPEFELTWIRESSGKRFLGGNVSDYEPNELVLIGPNVPHCWQSNKDSSHTKAQAIVIQFHANFAGAPFLELPESIQIKSLFERVIGGILIKGETQLKITSKLMQCVSTYGLLRLLQFIEILDLIANSNETEPIDQQFGGLTTSTSDTERFQKVFNYLIGNYREEIDLKSVAQIANLTPTAFCRYFKSVTRKTLVEVVTEFRINQACQMLRNTQKSVNEICFESGFGNISYFNKTFKAITKHTPLHYRSMFIS